MQPAALQTPRGVAGGIRASGSKSLLSSQPRIEGKRRAFPSRRQTVKRRGHSALTERLKYKIQASRNSRPEEPVKTRLYLPGEQHHPAGEVPP